MQPSVYFVGATNLCQAMTAYTLRSPSPCYSLGITCSRGTTAISELTGQAVSTWSKEWRIGTEARAILKMSKLERDMFFNGRKDENGKTIGRGVVGIRGPESC
jgi:hypothetical protein